MSYHTILIRIIIRNIMFESQYLPQLRYHALKSKEGKRTKIQIL